MGLNDWADKQVRKRDLRRAIEETHFHRTMLQGLAAALKVTEFNEAAVQEFDKSLPEYLGAVVSDLRQRETWLWGFKGNPIEWTHSLEMVSSERVLWHEDRRERLVLAVDLIEDLRRHIENILRELESGSLAPQAARSSVLSAFGSFSERCADHSSRLED